MSASPVIAAWTAENRAVLNLTKLSSSGPTNQPVLPLFCFLAEDSKYFFPHDQPIAIYRKYETS